MQYELKIGDRSETLTATPLDENANTTVQIGDAERSMQLRAVTPQQIRHTEGGRGSDVFVARCAEGTWVWSDGRARLVQDAATQTSTRRGSGGGVGGDVTPPMPSVVQELLVAVNDTVDKGARLVVVSAMKMETTLVAPHAGMVKAVNTEVGAKVAPGDILVGIEKIPEDGGSDG